MSVNVIMPVLGMSQDSGKILTWHKREGDAVLKGEPLFEVETDKTVVDIEAPESGILCNVVASEGDEVPVAQVIAVIAAEGEAPLAAAEKTLSNITGGVAESPAAAMPVMNVSPLAARIALEHDIDLRCIKNSGARIEKADVLSYIDHQNSKMPSPDSRSAPILASPKARRLALEKGVDLRLIKGKGAEGAILAADVSNHLLTLDGPQPQPVADKAQTNQADGAGQVQPVSRVWQVMAERMTQVWSNVPHFFLMRDVDASRLVEWRGTLQKHSQAKITFTDLLIKLTAMSLRKHPRLNAAWADGALHINQTINIGLAIGIEEGLVVPVIQQADELGLQAIAAKRGALAAAAQAGRLLPGDLQGGTFTISNLGMFGVDSFLAVINPPQAAILAVGKIADRVVPVGGCPVVRPILSLSLSVDHRVADGMRAAQFLDTLATFIEEPLHIFE